MGLLSFAGDLLSAGANLYGGSKQRKLAKRQFNAQMDQAIQRRVADARKAGVHPLFALGSSAGGSPTTYAGDGGIGAAGEALGSAVKGLKSGKGEQRLLESQISASEASAKRDLADAALSDAQAAKLAQEMNSQGRDGFTTTPLSEAGQLQYGPIEYVSPQVPYSSRLGVQAGVQPGTVDIVLPDGRTVNLLRSELGLDELAQIDYAMQRSGHLLEDAWYWLADKINERPSYTPRSK